MKKLLLMLAAILPFFIFTSCTEEEEEIEIELTNIRLNVESLKLEVGDTYQFEAITSPSNYPQDDFVWTVVAKDDKTGGGYIDDTGLFMATKSGKVIVEVLNHEIRDNSSPLMWADAIVTILGEGGEDEEEEEKPEEEEKTQISNIAFDKQSISIKRGETAYIDYTIQPSDADVSGIRWSVSDNSIISIVSTSNGRISINAIKAGEAEVYTTVNGKRYSCQVTVEAIKVERIELSEDEIEIKEKGTYQIEAEVYPEDADDKKLVYTSSDENVAAVSSNGEIRGRQAGKCTITVSTSDGSVEASMEVTVTEIPIEDQIHVSISSAGMSVGGYVTGSFSVSLYNYSNKTIYVKSFTVYDTSTNEAKYQKEDLGDLDPQNKLSSSFRVNNIYNPLFVWEYEYNGKTYKIEQQYD